MDPTPILPIRGATVELTFTAPESLRFFHQPLVSALARGLMGGALADEPRLWIHAPESGRVPFARGDAYRFQVFCCNGAEGLLDTLIDRLRRLPAGLDADAAAAPLGANLRFHGLTDAFTGERIKGFEDLFAYDEAALAREVGFYCEQPPVRLRLLSRAADPANLELAYRSIRANAKQRRGGGGGPGDEPEDDIAALAWVEHPEPVDAMLDRIGMDLRDASYEPRTLRGFILRQEGKSPRPLAVPPFADRVAQRALMQVMQTDCAPLLSAASYGYRRGLSRMDARDRLQSLYRQGYEWVYEADIDGPSTPSPTGGWRPVCVACFRTSPAWICCSPGSAHRWSIAAAASSAAPGFPRGRRSAPCWPT